jgi:hypothetical protein
MNVRSTPTRRLRRVVSHAAIGLAVAATLAVSGPGGTAQAAAEHDCDTAAGSSARVMPGYDIAEPHHASGAELTAMNATLERRVDRLVANGRLTAKGNPAHDKTIRIRTHVHVLAKKDGTGLVSRERIRRQIQVMNAGFAGRTSATAASSPFRFVIDSVDVTKNDKWYGMGLDAEGEETALSRHIKRKLHRGGLAQLNVYVAALPAGLLGYANYPGTVPHRQDGLVILNESMPGGAAAPFNKGDTATHEIGHWLGLAHTFDNGCEHPGDFVKDTPYQDDGDNVFLCSRGLDTCPQPGNDPIHNFMSYGDDTCMNQFTRGQVKRALQFWFAVRAGR